MSMSTWWLYAVMTFFISAAPGPNMLLVMSSSARNGFVPAIATMAGCMTALMVMLSLSAAGLGTVLHAFPLVFDALRLCGAAYLAYLGVQCWRAPVNADAAGASTPPAAGAFPSGAWARYRQGVLVAASNPKAILFAAAFFPQFMRADVPQLPQFVILLLTFAVIESTCYVLYAACGHQLSSWLSRASVLRAFNRATGGVFIGFAAVMALVRE